MKNFMFFLLFVLQGSALWGSFSGGHFAEWPLSSIAPEKGDLVDCKIVMDESSSVENEICGKFDKCSTLDSVFTSLLRQDAKFDTNIKISDLPDNGELVIFGSSFLQKVTRFHHDQTLENLIKNSIPGKSDLSLKVVFYLKSELTPRIRD